MLSEFEKKMLSLTGVNNDSKTKQLMNFMATQHSRKVYISEDEYKNTTLGTWLKKANLNPSLAAHGLKSNTNYVIKMSADAVYEYAKYMVAEDYDDIGITPGIAKKYKIEKGNNEFNLEGASFSDTYIFEFYNDEGNNEFLWATKDDESETGFAMNYTELNIIEHKMGSIEIEFEIQENTEVYLDGDGVIYKYIAINEPQRQYIDDRGLFEVRNGEDGHFYALVLSYVDETSIKYLVLSHTGAITLFDPENDGFKSLEDLETVDGENAVELEDLFKAVKGDGVVKVVNWGDIDLPDNFMSELVNFVGNSDILIKDSEYYFVTDISANNFAAIKIADNGTLSYFYGNFTEGAEWDDVEWIKKEFAFAEDVSKIWQLDDIPTVVGNTYYFPDELKRGDIIVDGGNLFVYIVLDFVESDLIKLVGIDDSGKSIYTSWSYSGDFEQGTHSFECIQVNQPETGTKLYKHKVELSQSNSFPSNPIDLYFISTRDTKYTFEDFVTLIRRNNPKDEMINLFAGGAGLSTFGDTISSIVYSSGSNEIIVTIIHREVSGTSVVETIINRSFAYVFNDGTSVTPL